SPWLAGAAAGGESRQALHHLLLAIVGARSPSGLPGAGLRPLDRALHVPGAPGARQRGDAMDGQGVEWPERGHQPVRGRVAGMSHHESMLAAIALTLVVAAVYYGGLAHG